MRLGSLEHFDGFVFIEGLNFAKKMKRRNELQPIFQRQSGFLGDLHERGRTERSRTRTESENCLPIVA